MNLESFKKILRMRQPELKTTVAKFLEEKKYKPVIGDGFVYAKGDIPILLVAHLDTVHISIPSDIYYDTEQDVMWSPQGIGGDDRCGVYLILKILENYKPYVLFTEDEEKGCIGAGKVVDTILEPDVKFIIEIDRRHADDCVFYSCGNKDFQKYIEKFGFKTAIGSCSDICTLSDEWEIASVNLSSGYYNEHTTSEIIKLKELEKTYQRVKEILDDDKNNKTYFDYQKVKYESKNFNYSKVPRDEDYFKKGKKAINQDKIYSYEDDYGFIDDDGQWHWWSDAYDIIPD